MIRVILMFENQCSFSPSKSSRVTELSTYSHQCLPSVDTGISQLDHLQARCIHTQAMTVGLCCRQKVVRWRLQVWEKTREGERGARTIRHWGDHVYGYILTAAGRHYSITVAAHNIKLFKGS